MILLGVEVVDFIPARISISYLCIPLMKQIAFVHVNTLLCLEFEAQEAPAEVFC